MLISLAITPGMKQNAFLILAHSDPKHLERLIAALPVEDEIFIHIDAKSELRQFTAMPLGREVVFLTQRHRVAWAGISMVSAIMELISAAVDAGKDYGHVVILTGADYPIKSAHHIRGTLGAHPRKEFVKLSAIRDSPDRYLKLIERRHYREPIFKTSIAPLVFVDKALRKSASLLRLPNPWREGVIPYRGHTWCALTFDCSKYILDFHEANPWYLEMNRNTLAPDEHYLHTIIGNSPFAENATVQKCQGGLWPMASTHLIDPSLTKWFTLADWSTIAESDKLFVRKVRSMDGSELVARIDAELLSRWEPPR